MLSLAVFGIGWFRQLPACSLIQPSFLGLHISVASRPGHGRLRYTLPPFPVARGAARVGPFRAESPRRGQSQMSQFNRFNTTKVKVAKTSATGVEYVDFKDVDNLRRLMSPNGKIYGRKRLSTTNQEQRLVCQAIKRARFLGLLPFTSATL